MSIPRETHEGEHEAQARDADSCFNRRDSALLKDEIVESLDEFLQTNATRLSKNATFEGYYGTGRRSTPFKIRDSSAAPNATSGEEEGVKSVVKARGRRATKIKQEPE